MIKSLFISSFFFDSNNFLLYFLFIDVLLELIFLFDSIFLYERVFTNKFFINKSFLFISSGLLNIG